MSVDLSQFVAAFLEESYEGLDIMESSLLELDSADVETINSIFRAAHSIKGGAGTFGLDEVANFTHIVETILDALRSDEMETSPDLVNLLLESVDCIRALLAASQGGDAADPSVIEDVHNRLKAVMGQNSAAAKDTVSSSATETTEKVWEIQFIPNANMLAQGHRPEAMFSALSELGVIETKLLTSQVPPLTNLNPEECYLSWALHLRSSHSLEEIEEIFEWVVDDCDLSIKPLQESVSAGTREMAISFKPDPELLHTGNDPYFIFDALGQLGELTTTLDASKLPKFSELDPEKLFLSWQLKLRTETPDAEVKELFEWVEASAELEFKTQGSEPTAQPARAAQAPTPTAATASAESASGPSETAVKAPSAASTTKAKSTNTETSSIRVETNKIDALINRVGELVITQAMLGQVGAELADDERVGALAERLQEGLGQLERNTRDLQQDVMRVRMLPISFVFNRFPRLVHDVSSKLGKKVELKLSGEQTEVDKTVMEKLGDPMVHLVRNSLDHGLEAPDERRAQGKSETGTLLLKAYHQGGNVIIEIIDDGRGLNTEKIRSKALSSGLITEEQNLSDDEVHDLIFQPGFSTADQVSDLSGRGVGMDVVRRNIESLGGNVSVKSRAGVGATITVSLPLTLAIMDGQLVRLGGDTYIIPLVSIVETIQASDKTMSAIGGERRLLHYRDEYIALIDLKTLFNLPPVEGVGSNLVAIVEHSGSKLALKVDELLGQQQVVIKSLEVNFKRVEGLSGATILGDGSVALILDIAGIDKRSHNQQILADEIFSSLSTH